MSSRRAFHAGSWYDDDPDTLASSLESWLSKAREAGVNSSASPALSGVIAPHAGYSYSGPAAAHAYAAIDPSKYTKVFVLGPSHHVHIRNQAALTPSHTLETPVGGLGVDRSIGGELLLEKSGSGRDLFFVMNRSVDEDEHSIEMHLPYLRQVFGQDAEPGGRVQFIPVMIGALDTNAEVALGAVFKRWLSEEGVLFVVSTDFCHWGSRFGFMPVDYAGGEIWESIERLDRAGMHAIEQCCSEPFARYIRKTRNTVCGRNPVGVLLSAVEQKGRDMFSIKFVHYEQSSKCRLDTDSSVSYASAHVRREYCSESSL